MASSTRSKDDNVAATSVLYDEMVAKWELVSDILGGTRRMRKAGTKWLPMNEREKQARYDARLGRSFLYEGTKDTRDRHASKPFSKPVELVNAETLPDQLVEIQADADLTGRTLDEFAYDLFIDGLDRGLTHILVDYPSTEGDLSLAEEERLALRPSFVQIKAKDLFAWKSESQANGEPVLTEIRWRVDAVEPTGAYLDRVVHRIRVMTLDTWQVWEERESRRKGTEWVLIDEGVHNFGSIPLTTMYFKRTGFMTAESPLDPLAWLNLMHWQSQSDQRNILRIARVGTLFAKGMSKKEIDGGLIVGANEMFASTSDSADMKYVEHTGKAISAGRQDLVDIEQKMEILGAQPIVTRANPTVLGTAISENKNISTIQAWIREEERALEKAYEFAGTWVKQPIPEDFAVDIWDDFGVSVKDGQELGELLKACVSGKISQETLIDEYKRRGVISEDVDTEEEIRRTQAEDDAGTGLGITPPNEPEPKEDE